MTKSERLVQMEKFWKMRRRTIKWESISWEPFKREGGSTDFKTVDNALMLLKREGVIFWTPSVLELEEEAYEFNWEWCLLDLPDIWYSMPEDWHVRMMVNEEGGAVFITGIRIKYLSLLFKNPHSVHLGLDEALATAGVHAPSEGNLKALL